MQAEKSLLTTHLHLLSNLSIDDKQVQIIYLLIINNSYNIKKVKKMPKSTFFSLSKAGAVGIEPTSTVLETAVLPLNYAPL